MGDGLPFHSWNLPSQSILASSIFQTELSVPFHSISYHTHLIRCELSRLYYLGRRSFTLILSIQVIRKDNSFYCACHSPQNLNHLILDCPDLLALRLYTKLFWLHTLIFDFWFKSWGVARLLGHGASIPRKSRVAPPSLFSVGTFFYVPFNNSSTNVKRIKCI